MDEQTFPARTRTITWDDPRIGAWAAPTMRGLDYLRAMMRGDVPPPPIAQLMDFTLAEIEEGRAVFTVVPAEYHYNPIGVVHGGLAATLCDSAMGCAIHSTLPAGADYTTLELKINFVRAMTDRTGVVSCGATVIYDGKRVATAEARVVDAAGKLYAHATTTYMIFLPEARGGAG